MDRLRGASLLFLISLLLPAVFAGAQTSEPSNHSPSNAPANNEPQFPSQSDEAAAATSLHSKTLAPPLALDAPRMTRQTRIQMIRVFETQLFYARTSFPMGARGLKLQDGSITPNGEQLQQALALWGPAIKPGDPAHLSFVQIKNDHIHFEINGGPVHRKKWYQHVQVSGANDTPVQMGPDEPQTNPHGTYLDVYFDKYVPEMTAQQLRDVMAPVLDFNARNKEEAYLDSVPPKVKLAILEHRVLVGMSTDMVLHSKGKAPKKVREKDGETEYEEWIYGEPPQDVDFVRVVGDEVVRVETMKVGGEKIVRTEREVIVEHPDRDTEAKKEQDEDRPANAPSLRRPGEDPDNVPRPADRAAPLPPNTPPPDSTPPRPGDPGPDHMAAGSR